MNKKGLLGLITIALICLVIFVVCVTVYSLSYSLTMGEETITIKEKWVKYQGGGAKYLTSSENGQVFQITDSILKWRWDSSDLYASLEENQNCNIKTQGWRFSFFSDYKNILEAECR